MSAFSNGTEFEVWSHNWCHQCRKDELGGAPEGTYCQILCEVIASGEIPAQWAPGSDDFADRYHCSEFEAT